MRYLTLLFIALSFGITAKAQSDSTSNTIEDSTVNRFLVRLHNGAEYIGPILSDDAREILINSEEIGLLYITKMEIKEIILIKQEKSVVDGAYVADDIFTTRYFFSTNGFTIKKKETYSALHLWGYEFQKTLKDNLSLGVMSTWAAAPIAVSVKQSIPVNDKLNFSLGSIVGTSSWIGQLRYSGELFFGSMTIGSRNNNVSLSAGGLFVQDLKPRTVQVYQGYDQNTGMPIYTQQIENNSSNSFLTSLSGSFRIGKKASFVMENLYFGNTDINVLAIVPGLRFSKRPDFAVQVGVAGVYVWRPTTSFDDDTIGFPVPFVTFYKKLN